MLRNVPDASVFEMKSAKLLGGEGSYFIKVNSELKVFEERAYN